MENNKKKYTLEIAGMPMTIVTDEPASFVESIITRLNERIAEMTAGSYRISTLDAALLCSIDYLGDKLKAEKRIRKIDKRRADYYKYFTGRLWHDAALYDLCLNTGHMSEKKCVELVRAYMDARFEDTD